MLLLDFGTLNLHPMRHTKTDGVGKLRKGGVIAVVADDCLELAMNNCHWPLVSFTRGTEVQFPKWLGAASQSEVTN